MKTNKGNDQHTPSLRVMWSLILSMIFVAVSSGQMKKGAASTQPPESPNGSVTDAIKRVESGEFATVHVETIAEAGATEAIPSLEEQFKLAKDPIDKAKIAEGLIRLKVEDDTYWTYLSTLVNKALDSDIPEVLLFDEQGKSTRVLSPEFASWVAAHPLETEAAANSLYVYPGFIIMLGGTHDARAIPLLERALSSPNYSIQIVAATGLAENHSESSVPLIVGACHRAPAEIATAMAESLVYFDSREAREAVEKYVPLETAKELRAKRAAGGTPLH